MRHMDFMVGLIINELKNRGKKAGKIQIQKLVYFLKKLGIRVPYSYVILRYGPFSGQLGDKIEDMEFNQMIESKDPSGTDYYLKIEEQDLIDYNEEQYNLINRKLNKVIEILPSLDFNDLELFATVHYCYDSLNIIYDEVGEQRLINEVKKWKGEKFTEAEILDAFNRMEEKRLV